MNENKQQSTFRNRPLSAKLSTDEFDALRTFIQHPDVIRTGHRNLTRRQITRELVAWLRTLKKSSK